MGKVRNRGTKLSRVGKDRRRRKAKAQSAPPHKIIHQYASPDALKVIGPFVSASWHIPLALQSRLERENRVVPAPIEGVILVDTGASQTCISIEAAQDLGLQQVNIQETYGMHGKQRTPMFQARLCLRVQNQHKSAEFFLERAVGGIVDIEVMFQKMGVQSGGKKNQRMLGLLGRDFLRHGTFKYYGTRGFMEIDLDRSLFGPPPSAQT